MQNLSLSSIGFYCIFAIFVFYQQLHAKNFKGASQALPLAINISALLGMITGISYLLYYGWTVAWWAPIPILIVGVAAAMAGVVIERLVGVITLSFSAFVGWPICAYLMFYYIPISA